MAVVERAFQARDSQMDRELQESSRFTTVNGNRSATSPPQTTSFRPDATASSEPFRQHAQSRQAAPLERIQRPLFVESERERKQHQDQVAVQSPESQQANRLGKRKRSFDSFLKVSPEFTSPPARRMEVFNPPTGSESPPRSLPPLTRLRTTESRAVTDHAPLWRQQRPNSAHAERQLSHPARRDSHLYQAHSEQAEGSDGPPLEPDPQSDPGSDVQHDPSAAKKAPNQPRRRNFSQRTKTGCHTCRERKKKCDEAKPTCQNCARGNFTCKGYGPKNELNVKLPSKTIPLQAKGFEGSALPGHHQTGPGAPTENWLEAQKRYSHDGRLHPFSEGFGYARSGGLRPMGPPDYDSPFVPDRFGRSSLSDAARAPPQSSRFSAISAPSIITDINGGSMHHGGGGGGSSSLGSAFDTPRASIGSRLVLNAPSAAATAAYPSASITSTVEKGLMLKGEPYRHFTDTLLIEERMYCREALERFNNAAKPFTGITEDTRSHLFMLILQPPQLLKAADPLNHPVGSIGSKSVIETPFQCDYGYNIHIGDDVFIQPGCVMYDPCRITIGRGTIVGPNVKFYGLGPSLDSRGRNSGQGRLRGGLITVEEDCFIGGDVIILPNVVIGRQSVVGAGTVVNKRVPPGTTVAGNPMRIVRDARPSPDPEYNARAHAESRMMGNPWPNRFSNRAGRMLMGD